MNLKIILIIIHFMKVNKIILKICHFFKYRLDEEHLISNL